MTRTTNWHPFAAVCLTAGGLLASPASAAIYNIDLNTVSAESYPVGTGVWNAYAQPSDINGSVIQDNTGSAAANITLSVSGDIGDSTRVGDQVFNNATGGPAWVSSPTAKANRGASGDYFFTNNSVTPTVPQFFDLTFAGLTPGTIVALDLWSARNGPVDGYYSYSLDGGTTWTGLAVLNKDGTATIANGWDTNNTLTQSFSGNSDGNIAARYMNASGIVLTGTTLIVRSQEVDTALATYTILNALRVTVDPIPEPASLSLLAASITLLGLKRRHHA